MNFLNEEDKPVEGFQAKWLVRLDGPEELLWPSVGPNSIGVTSLPVNTPIKISTVVFRAPSADGSNKMSGSKNPVVKMGRKTPDQVFLNVKREFANFTFRLFETREECLTFIATGLDDWGTLNVEPGSSAEVVKQAYYDLSRIHHPDKKTGNENTFKNLTAAYKRLCQ